MSDTTLKDRAQKIVSDHLGVAIETVTDDAAFAEDLTADSLDMVELAMEFEEQFAVEIPDDDLEKITTFGEAVTYLESRVAATAK